MFHETAEESPRLRAEILTEETKAELRKHYKADQYLTSAKKSEIAEKYNSSYRAVNNWFKNECAKESADEKMAGKKRCNEKRTLPAAGASNCKIFTKPSFVSMHY